MISILKFKLLAFPGLRGGLFDCDCACAAPVNNQPLADASVASAKVMADLGDRQLAETRRQYDLNTAIAKPVIDSQLQIMQQTKDQGDDYYNYLKTFRPTEQKMLTEANQDSVAANDGERAAIVRAGIVNDGSQVAQDAADRKLLTSSRNVVYDTDSKNIESQVGTAVADARAGYSRTLNQMIREGARYGMSPSAIVANMGAASTDQASREVAAANSAREAGIDSVLQRTAAGREMRQADFDRSVGFQKQNQQTLATGRNMRLQDSAADWAKRLDIVGIAKGLPGASQGAYSLANQSGNSAVANQNSNGQMLLNGMSASAALTGQGQQMKLQGLTSILNSDTAIAQSNNARAASQGASGLAGMMSGLGGLGQGLGAIGFKL